MSSSSSSSSSSSEEKRPFDVFINFRGEDVRYGFVADLHKCLLHRRINAYIDSEDLRRGDEIKPALTKAIMESRIAVLVFSENYASSTWCLDELVKVMECRRNEEQRVLPVFYKVDPGVIRKQRESYGKALASHGKKLGKNSERVKKWRQALTEAGNLSGWHYDHGDDTKFIESIVKEISTIIGRVPLNVANYPVGVGCREEKVMSLLGMGLDDIRMIGIRGTGGVGKTTIAKAVYNRIAKQFDGCSFLRNVRETSRRPDGLVHLQNTLLSDILWKEKFVVSSVDEGANLIPEILCYRKILLVLDDVDHGDQLDALARKFGWFGKGSRIIITTRDEHILTSCGEDRVYEVDLLNQGEAFELLTSHAFQGNNTKDISRDLIDKILGYAGGLPLAIVVLGDFLRGRSGGEWESTLEKLAESPNEGICKVLMISFDALEDNERNIFLDIACFFKGDDRDYVTRVLDGCGLHTLIGIKILIERSLVTIEQGTRVQMHDLIQQMGQDIVKRECPDNPGRRSRLWCYDDVFEVLSKATGTEAVKGIVLRLLTQKELHINPSAFSHMSRLKLLILWNARISGVPICLPNDLRWLVLHGCHLSTLKFSAGPKKLVCFDVDYGWIEGFGGNLKDFEKLKFINLTRCQSLVRMPELNYTPNLEELYITDCKNLELVHGSFAYHRKLRELILRGCSKVQSFPNIPVKNEALQILSLEETGIKEIPASIKNLVSLTAMYLDDNKELAILPSSIYKLQNLERLRLEGCSKLIKFPKEEEDLSETHAKTGFPMLLRLDLGQCHLSEKFHCQTNHRVVLPGGEMPKWLLPNEEGYISFVASKDLYKKILGVAFCVVFRVVDQEGGLRFEIMGNVDCKATVHRSQVRSFNSYHVWLQYMESEECGFRLICKSLENDTEILLEDDQLLDPALLYEVSLEDNPTSIEKESSSGTVILPKSDMFIMKKEVNVVDFSIEKHRYSSKWSKYKIIRPGREMPEEFVLVEDTLGEGGEVVSRGLDQSEGSVIRDPPPSVRRPFPDDGEEVARPASPCWIWVRA
ncbi:disease resistance protein RUN1 [Eucalyptus grandis]|uniref:disease resistance protein RUN1 n=1 Tax=Eucalyptus grandis TaxID=71139 RepID=UPI00192E85B4|nr:disease resistance protein RUN1 [Eucalyptus grandis]